MFIPGWLIRLILLPFISMLVGFVVAFGFIILTDLKIIQMDGLAGLVVAHHLGMMSIIASGIFQIILGFRALGKNHKSETDKLKAEIEKLKDIK